jgi:Flp pilus assembly pilin Flp
MSSFWDENGTVIVEYGLVLALLSVGFIAGMITIDTITSAALGNAQTSLVNYGLRIGL